MNARILPKVVALIMCTTISSQVIRLQDKGEFALAEIRADSTREKQLRRQGITREKERKLLSKGISLDNQNVREPEGLAVFSEVVLKGVVTKEPKEIQIPFPISGDPKGTWGTVMVEVRVSKVFKCKNVDSDKPLSVRTGEVLEVYDVHQANGLLFRKALRYNDFRLHAGDEAYFFLNRGIPLMKSRNDKQYHCLDVFPDEGGAVKFSNSRGVTVRKKSGELERTIMSTLDIFSGGNRE
jgi:hypothetical protein